VGAVTAVVPHPVLAGEMWVGTVNGGVWQTLKHRSLFNDAGYQVTQTSRVPSNFVAASLG